MSKDEEIKILTQSNRELNDNCIRNEENIKKQHKLIEEQNKTAIKNEVTIKEYKDMMEEQKNRIDLLWNQSTSKELPENRAPAAYDTRIGE